MKLVAVMVMIIVANSAMVGGVVDRLDGAGKGGMLAQLTIEEGVENELAVLLDQVVDVSENSAVSILSSAIVLLVAR